METLFYLLKDNFPVLFTHKYFFVFAAAATEGFNLQILSGFLVGVVALSLWPTFLANVLGQFANGFLFYGIGYYAGSKPLDYWSKRHPKFEKIIAVINKHFVAHSGKTLLLTRLTISFTVAALITAGSLKYDIKKFMLYNFIGGTGWSIITMGFGYFFGEGFMYIFKYFTSATLIFMILIGVALVIFFVFKIVNKFIEKVLRFNEKIRELGDKVMHNIDRFISNEEIEN